MHMKELPMFLYNLGMGNYLHQDTSCKLLCLVINNAMSSNFKHVLDLMCTLHNFFSNKARFSVAVTRLHFCSGKKIRVRLALILFLYRNQYFRTFLVQNIQQRVIVFHSGPGSMPPTM